MLFLELKFHDLNTLKVKDRSTNDLLQITECNKCGRSRKDKEADSKWIKHLESYHKVKCKIPVYDKVPVC